MSDIAKYGMLTLDRNIFHLYISVQVIDLSEAQLVYNTSIFKSLATGGNVSQALVSSG